MVDKQFIATVMGPVVLRRAEPGELDLVLDILEEAARWQFARGIDQWRPESFKRGPFQAPIAEQVAQGSVYLASQEGEALGTITLQWNDPMDTKLWECILPHEDAGYIHRLAIRRVCAGLGVGRCLLRWAEQTILDLGKQYVRLDCMATNGALCAYYERAGYVCRGEVQGNGWEARLYERQLQGNVSA